MKTHSETTNPRVAALLNALPLPLGFGYYYLGMKRRFFFAFLVGIFAALLGLMLGLLVAGIFEFRQSFGGDQPPMFWWLIALAIGAVPVILVAAISAWDARRLSARR